MSKVTFDLSAKITGYEASLKQLKESIAKIDLGSDIGKNISAALKAAEAQVKSLSKNLTPQATSDTQIDNIVNKVNLAGESIQKLADLIQKVNGTNLDLSSLDGEIQQIVKDIADLQKQMDQSIDNGLRQFLAGGSDSANELKEVFKSLGVSIEDISEKSARNALSEGLKQANSEAKKAQAALDKINTTLNEQKAAYAKKFGNNPLANEDFSEATFATQMAAIKNPDKILDTQKIEAIKQQMLEGLSNLKLDAKSDLAIDLLDSFFSGLTPENIHQKLNSFVTSVNQELGVTKGNIRAQLLNGQTEKGFIDALFGLDESQVEDAKTALTARLNEIAAGLKPEQVASIKTLIDQGKIEEAKQKTLDAMRQAYEAIKREMAAENEEIARLTADQNTKSEAKTAADARVTSLTNAQSSYDQEIKSLQSTVQQQAQEIQNLKDRLDASLNDRANQIKNDSSTAGNSSQSFKISTAEASKYKAELAQVQAREKLVGKIEGVVQRWFSIYAAVRMVSNAIKSVIATVKELDKTITEIAIVTDMTQDDLWKQMSDYTNMARQYAASISGVYRVSQLYYQQGLQTADVMALTEQTLKMARISGLDYADATNYMTNAVRSFKMEMTDAQRVVDVYSAIAASSATSTAELASAMSKTASSAESVGSSFENTTAMMAVMIEATRESAENIGSAMKSIISRYGEMKTNPMQLIDSEGEAMSLNKVDTALKAVGISIQDTNHEFREFDDVIFELAGKWDTIDKNTQRYIATVMAGNRQQSRFLALVSNGERLAELSEEAANSEDAATLQVLKTMDSIEAKTQQLKTSLQSLYTSTGVQNLFKWILDIGNNIVTTFTRMTTVFGLPIPAILKIGTTFYSLANVVSTVFGLIKTKIQAQISALTDQEKVAATTRISIANEEALERVLIQEEAAAKVALAEGKITEEVYKESAKRLEAYRTEAAERQAAAQSGQAGATAGNAGFNASKNAKLSLGLSAGSLAISAISGVIKGNSQAAKAGKGLLGVGSSTLSGAGIGAQFGGPYGAIIGGAIGLVTGAIQNWSLIFESSQDKIKRLGEEAENAKNEAIKAKSEYQTLQQSIDTLDELKAKRNESAEATEEYQAAVDELASKFPEMIAGFDAAGNIILDTTNAEEMLTKARQKSAQAAFDAAEAELATAKAKLDESKNKVFTPEHISSISIHDTDSQSERRKEYLTSGPFSGFLGYDDIMYNTDDMSSGLFVNWFAQYYQALSDEQKAEYSFFQDFIDSVPKDEVHNWSEWANMLSSFLENREGLVDDKVASEFYSLLQADNNKQNATIEEINSLIDQLKAVDDITSDEGIEIYRQLNEKVNNFVNTGTNAEEYADELESVLAFLDANNPLMSDFLSLSDAYKGYERAVISAWQQTNKNNLESWEYLDESAELAAIVSKQILSDLGDKDFKSAQAEQESQWEEYQKAAEKFYSNLSSSDQALFNQMLSDTDNYSATDIIKQFGITDKEGTDLYDLIINYYSDGAEKIKERLQTNLEENYHIDFSTLDKVTDTSFITEYAKLINDTNIDITQNEERYLQYILTQYEKLKDKGLIDHAETFGQASLDLFKEIGELPADVQKFVLAQITENGITTREGIDTILKSIEGNDEIANTDIVKDLTNLRDNIIENLSLSLQVAISDLTSSWDDASKEIKKLTSGMSLKEVDDFIQKAKSLGIEIDYNDFKQSGDKLILSADAYNEYWANYSQKMSDNAAEWQTMAAEATSHLEDLDSKDLFTGGYYNGSMLEPLTINQETFDFIEKLTGDAEAFYDNINYVDAAGKLTEAGRQVLEEAADGAEKQADYYAWLATQANDEVTKSLQWAKGNYASLISSSGLGTQSGHYEGSELVWEDVLDVEAFKKYLTGELQYDAEQSPDLKAAVQQARSGVNTFLSDLLSKGTDDINVSDYAELGIESSIYDAMVADLELVRTGEKSYQEFILEYAQYTGKTTEEINDEILKAIKKDNTTSIASQKKAFANLDIVGNIITGTEDQIFALAEALGIDDAASLLGKQHDDGTYELVVNDAVQTALDDLDIIKQSIPDQLKNYADTLDSATNMIIDGTTDFAKMQDFANQYAKTLGLEEGSVNWQDLFSFNESTGNYTLSITAFNNYVDAQNKILKDADVADVEIARVLNDANKQLASAVDIAGYLKSDRRTKARGDLTKQLTDYYEAMARQETQNLPDYAKKTALDSVSLRVRQTISALDQGGAAAVEEYRKFIQASEGRDLTAEEVRDTYLSELTQYQDAFAELNEGIQKGSIITSDILRTALQEADFEIDENGVVISVGNMLTAYQQLYQGMKETGEATTAELNSAYLDLINANNNQDNAVNTILSSASSLDTSALENFASTMNFTLESILTEAGEVTEEWSTVLKRTGIDSYAITDWDTYIQLVEDKLGHTIDKHSQEYIDAYIDWLDNNEVRTPEGQAQLMASLTSGINKLTRAQIGQIAYAFGKTYDEVEKMLAKNADGTYDGRALLEELNFDRTSPEYVSALKTLNDAVIEENKLIEDNIVEEIQSLSDAQQGDQVNVTQLVSALNDEANVLLTEKLAALGATLKDGILTLENDANIPAIIQTLANEAAENGLILESSMAELADTLNDVLQNYTDLISSGIEGKLSSSGAQSLQAQAKSLGYIGKLDFKKTASGLKLSEDSAYQLYMHLKSIDGLKASLVFDNLYNSITNSNKNLKTMSGTMATITKTQNQIKANEAEIAALRKNSNNSGRINQLTRENEKLKEQLGLYEQIAQRQMSNPDSYSFMDQELPDIFKGAENYWNSVGTAFKAMNEAGESGKISIQDFYNIANEMNNLATLSGNTLEFMGQKLDGSAESAAALIQKGFSALSNIDGEGVAIDLNKLGVDFKNGADDMQVGFQEGIQSMAKSQIAMLDAQIQLLETIVAMEKLGEIDSNGNGIFEFIKEELGTLDDAGFIEEFGEGYKRAIDSLKKYFTETDNEDLKNAYKNVKICGHTIEELLNASEADLRNWGIKGEILQKLLQGLWDLSQSGDFDPQNIMASITSLLAELGLDDLEFSVDTGDMTVVVNSTGDFTIDWDSATAQAAMEVFGDEVANKHDALQTALNNYIAGKTDATELKAALTYKGIISADIEKPDHTIVDGVSYQNGSSELEVAIAKAALKDVGATEISSIYNEEMGTIEATGSIKIGNKKVQVTNDGSKTTYHSTMTGQDYGTVEALRDAEYSYALDQFYKGYRENPGTQEQFEAIEYGIPIEFNPTVETQLNTNALREQALEIARTPVNIIQDAINSNEIDRQVNDDGTITYDFAGIKVTVANKGSVEQRVAAAQQELVNTVDPDGMITKIAAGIQSAFTDDENTIGNAIGNGIVNALKTADFSDKDFEVPEAEATLSKLDITDVESAEMAQNALASMFGVKNNTLTLEEATAKISKLVISGADSTDFSAVEQNGEKQSNLTIPEATADLTTLKLGEIGEIDSSDVEDEAEAVGENLGEGIITGTENKKEDVTNAGKALGEAAVEGANDGAQTHSPSKATEQTGKDLVSGLVVGMSDTSAAVTAAQTLAQTVIQTIQNYFNSNPIAISTSMGTNTSTPQTPQTPSVDTSGLAAVQAAVASISAAGQAATASITTLNNNLNNISDNGSAKATDFQAALNKITDVGKTKAENFQTALASIGNNGQLKAEAFQAALSKIGNNGYVKATAFQSALSKISNIGAERANAFRDALKSIGQTGITRANNFASAVNGVGSSGAANANNFRNALNGISRSGPDHAANFKKALNNINQTTLKVNVKVTTTGASAQVTGNLNPWWSWAKGNVSSSNSHVALAGGKAKTLMGELGPELVVSNGRYFLVGENGPEMVDLADDAIVFNHLQTKKLMKNGSVNTHGQPVTNEKKATSMATGSFVGDAFASASEALAYLKQLREMWKSLLGASAKELGALAGRGRGSGGSGGGGSDTDPSGTSERSTTADIERWYNLLRQIDKLEQDITYQQQLQNKLTSDRNTNGRALYNSYKAELDALDQEIAKSRELATIQKSWYDAKRRELNNSEYSKIFTYDENGLQQYTQGRGRGLDILEHLTATDANGQPVGDAATSSSQLAYLKRVGFNIDSLLVGSDGSRVAYRGADGKLYDKDNKELTGQELADAQTAMMENFWDNVDGWKDEMDSLYDSYHEQEQNILEAEQRRNEILQKLVDNQLSLEQTILKAVEDMRQAEIDNLQDERDAYEESVNKMVAGLNESLSNERKMYESQQDNTELNRLQRQLALLQRTGGSGASIRNLQEQIESKQQDMYFTERQNEIDAIQEAADRQIERLDEQINIMTETLAYQKENGLLWKDVYTVMQGTPAEIADFITANTQEWSSKSTLAQSEDLRALKQIIETYTAQRDDPDNPTNEEDDHDWNVFAEANKNRYEDIWRDEKDNAKEIFDKKLKETGDSNQASRVATDYLNQKMRDRRAQPVEPEVEEVEIVLGEYSGSGSRDSDGGSSEDSGGSGDSGGGSNGGGGSQGQSPAQQITLPPKEKAQKYGKQVAAAIWEYPGGSGWGNGDTRKKNITAKGMDYSIVQGYVNQMAKKNRKQRLSMAGLSSVSELAPYTFAGFAFKNGGLIDYTGPAWVDGSPSKPEYILNAEQTAALRKQLISSKTSHQNLIGEAISAADKIANASASTTNSTNTDNSIGINNLNFTMQVAKIADDYDAKKAGEKVMNEMVRIARKNGDRSVSRR